MKVMLVNGSPHREGCTDAALKIISETLKAEGIDSEIFWIGNKPIGGCIGCFQCAKKKQCVFRQSVQGKRPGDVFIADDIVNEFTEKALGFDGFIFGSPVYYSGMNGSLMSFMDRAFFSASGREPHPFRFKPAAAVVSARRAGTTSALDQINKYFQHQQMPIITSRYWNMVHGNTPEEVMQDVEGLQILRVLARNMAWFLKLKEAGEREGIIPPEQETERIATNFIR